MKFQKTFYSLAIAAFAGILPFHGVAQFSNDNLAILVAAASANNTTVSVVEINKTHVNQTAIQTISIPGDGANPIRVSGSATSTLYAANSADGSLFCFTGHYSDITNVNANTILPRAVVTIDNAGSISIPALYNGSSGQQTRGATTINNLNYYIADQGGQYTNNATSPSPSGNFRKMMVFGGIVYVGRASTTSGVTEVSTTSALTGGTITPLPGLTNNNNFQDFYLISSGNNGSDYDVLYIVRATSNTAGTIVKYSLVSGTWIANGTYTTNFGGFGLAAEKAGTGAFLYVSTGQGALTGNSVLKLTDAAGYNQTINITNNIVLYTAASGTIVKGIAFAPQNTSTTPQVATPVLSPAGGSFYAPFSVTITCSTAGSTIYYTTDGTDPDENSTEYTVPIYVNSTTVLKARAYAPGYDPSNISAATYIFPPINDVADIATLRTGATDGTAYRLTGEAVLTAKNAFNNRKFIRDNTAAIMIFDPSAVITTNYNIGDGITNIVGTLSLANNMLRFIPLLDPGAPSSTGNSVQAVTFTIPTLTSGDQAKLVKLQNVTFTSTGTFANGTNYTITDGSNTMIFRTDFFNVDYIGTSIPSTLQNITGVIIQYNADLQIVARNLADFEEVIVAVDPPESFTAEASGPSQIDLDFKENEAGDPVVIVFNDSGIFSAPAGTPPASGQPFAGGTLFYVGLDSPQSHTGLSQGQTVYYRAWSFNGFNYSTGLDANATTHIIEPSNHVTNFNAVANTSTSITVTWNDSGAAGYLIKGSTGGYNDISAPVDGFPENDGDLVKNIASGIQTHQFTGLNPSTAYYFKIYPYNGSGASINYKTDGAVPQANATTPGLPTMTEILLPQFIQGLNGTNSTRVPYAFRVSFSNLLPNATYRYINQVVIASDGGTAGGAGNVIFVNPDNTFTRTTSPGFTTPGTYGQFTTDANGSYIGWFMTEPTGNVRFTPGNDVFMRIRLNDGTGGTSAVHYFTTANPVKVINFGNSNNANMGTGIRGVSLANPKNFVFLFDNVSQSGRPLYGTSIETTGVTFTGNNYAAFYTANVEGVNGSWGGIVPNVNEAGVRLIAEYSISTGNIVNSHTSANGIWGSANTVNPTGGTSNVLVIDLMPPAGPPDTLDLIGNVPTGEVNCYAATETVFVHDFTVQPGASAEVIAGINIFLQPGTIVYEGATFRAWIDLMGNFCNQPQSLIASKPISSVSLQETTTDAFRYYPNPVNGLLTIEIAHSELVNSHVLVELYNLTGTKVFSTITGSSVITVDMALYQPGMYMINLIKDGSRYSGKLIRK